MEPGTNEPIRTRGTSMWSRLTGALLLTAAITLPSVASAATPTLPLAASEHAVCLATPVGSARCHAHVATDGRTGAPLASVTWSAGYAPTDLQSAYNLLATAGSGQTVAIVDAYDNPNAAADLLAYRTRFGLPLCTGGGVSCFFTKVNQSGASAP